MMLCRVAVEKKVIPYIQKKKKKKIKRLPLETKNKQKNESRRLGFIKSHHNENISSVGWVAPYTTNIPI